MVAQRHIQARGARPTRSLRDRQVLSGRRSVRHHTVPQFYLRRFADYDERLRALNVDSGDILERQHIKNVAFENDFHTLTKPRELAVDLESAFAQVEGVLAEGLRSIDEKFPPTQEAREAVSVFVAFQFVRSSRWRQVAQDAMSDLMTRSTRFIASYTLKNLEPDAATSFVQEQLGDDTATQDEALQLLESLSDPQFAIEVDHSQHLQQMVEVLTDRKYVDLVARRSWAMCYTDARHEFLISDHPIGLRGSPFPSGHAGLGNALELSLPLDRRRLLLMTLDPGDEGKRREVSALDALNLNSLVRDSALRFVYGHPLVPDEWLRGDSG
ncbi:MAG: DUF4238 domain-containing protein [Chloroflexi bacterium]|nr:DUF4238 domain-containing protein [Chloroflexota bacterium]